MKIAVTGGTGFVGRNVVELLSKAKVEVAVISRRMNKRAHTTASTRYHEIGLEDQDQLARAFSNCDAVVHAAGLNREIGRQTYEHVHIKGTRNVVEAARTAGVKKIVLVSFLRARPDCGSPYHESKWAAEEIVRNSGLNYTILKCGVIYGKGDHMLDHLSHALYTFPLFALVGFWDKPIRPNAVEDVARIIKASALEGALQNQTVPVVGPDHLTLRQAVRRVGEAVGRRPFMFPMPVWFHYLLGWLLEKIMTVPMVAVSQVRILSEGLAEPSQKCDPMPSELAPKIRFTQAQIRRGLPPPGPFRFRDLRCCNRHGGNSAPPHHKPVPFLEIP